MAAAMTVNSANLAVSVHDSYKECSKKNLDLMQFNYQKGQVNLNACPSDPGQEEGYKNFSAEGNGCALSMLAAAPDLIPFAGPLLGKVAKGILVGLKAGKASPEGYDRFRELIETLPNVPPNRVQAYLASYEKMSPEMQEKFVDVMKKYQKVSCK